jgi:hypothetical protein
MTEPDPIGIARSLLHDAITEFQPPSCHPLTISIWVAMSLLQKAIRRGREELAYRAAAMLQHGSPERLWRRLGCIAFEDVGVGDLDTAALVTAAMAGKRFRSELGGEWAVWQLSHIEHVTGCKYAERMNQRAPMASTMSRTFWNQADVYSKRAGERSGRLLLTQDTRTTAPARLSLSLVVGCTQRCRASWAECIRGSAVGPTNEFPNAILANPKVLQGPCYADDHSTIINFLGATPVDMAASNREGQNGTD